MTIDRVSGKPDGMLTRRKYALTLWTQMDATEIRDALADLYEDDIHISNAKKHAVARARTLGLSWEQIARQLNMTRQSAWERWHHLDPTEQ